MKNYTYVFYVFYVFFENPKNMTFYVFCVVSHIFSNIRVLCNCSCLCLSVRLLLLLIYCMLWTLLPEIKDPVLFYSILFYYHKQMRSVMHSAASVCLSAVEANVCSRMSFCDLEPRLTPSTPAVPDCCFLKGPEPYWSNPAFLISDIRALWRSGLSARAPECQKLKMLG